MKFFVRGVEFAASGLEVGPIIHQTVRLDLVSPEGVDSSLVLPLATPGGDGEVMSIVAAAESAWNSGTMLELEIGARVVERAAQK